RRRFDNACGCTDDGAGSANPKTQAKDSSIRFAASARHQKAIPNQHASYEVCDTVHMYVARKNVLENRAITPILKGEMYFATETRLAARYLRIRDDLAVNVDDANGLRQLLIDNSIRALIESLGTNGISFFR